MIFKLISFRQCSFILWDLEGDAFPNASNFPLLIRLNSLDIYAFIILSKTSTSTASNRPNRSLKGNKRVLSFSYACSKESFDHFQILQQICKQYLHFCEQNNVYHRYQTDGQMNGRTCLDASRIWNRPRVQPH